RVIRIKEGYSLGHRKGNKTCQNTPLGSRACQWSLPTAAITSSVMIRAVHLMARIAAAGLSAAISSAAFAADVSRWQDSLQSSARLVAAQARSESGGRIYRAAVEIKLQDGWKTYWRYPGDSGVPPALDFSKSRNVKSVTVLYPAPSKFPDGAGGNSIGYK